MNLLKKLSLLFIISLTLFAKEDIVQKEELLEKDSVIKSTLEDNNWHIKYNNHNTYNSLQKEYLDIKWKLKKLLKQKKTSAIKKEIIRLRQAKDTRLTEIELLKEYKNHQFGTLTNLPEIKKSPIVDNPLLIVEGFGYIKYIKQIFSDMSDSYSNMQNAIELLKQRQMILEELNETKELSYINQELESFDIVKSTMSTTLMVYEKKFNEIEESVSDQIKGQFVKMLSIFIMIVVLFFISFSLKLLSKKYVADNERYYMTNKVINIVNVVLIIFILLFSYLENVSYLVTFLGFASAGIAIAMKDWFMSILGWFVMTLGGSIHVGDRIRVAYDGMVYVGDVLDISMLRITLQEDITLTTYMVNKRAGRIIFIPNNFIFTQMIANYSHAGMKTVWDGVEVSVTFNSNHKKALHIAKEIVKKYSKGYTDITRKQLNKLRDKYNLRNTNVDPRAFHFIEPYGMKIAVWYQTNSYATLTLKSTISAEIIEQYMQEDDITIAYPTQNINIQEMNKGIQ